MLSYRVVYSKKTHEYPVLLIKEIVVENVFFNRVHIV